MRQIMFIFLICLTTGSQAQNSAREKVVKAYYMGFQNHNWKTVNQQFADGFTFTSPNNDDHITVDKFKEKCWPTNSAFKKVNFIKMSESGNDVFLLVEITTTENKLVRNVDLFHFNAAKIKSIETFFGPGGRYPGNRN